MCLRGPSPLISLSNVMTLHTHTRRHFVNQGENSVENTSVSLSATLSWNLFMTGCNEQVIWRSHLKIEQLPSNVKFARQQHPMVCIFQSINFWCNCSKHKLTHFPTLNFMRISHFRKCIKFANLIFSHSLLLIRVNLNELLGYILLLLLLLGLEWNHRFMVSVSPSPWISTSYPVTRIC